MPRRTIPFIPNLIYHIYNRGNNRQAVFFERENYGYFLRGMKKYLCEQMDILAYCLIPTHYHILGRVKPEVLLSGPPVQTSEVFATSEVWTGTSEVAATPDVSSAMQKLGISYTKAINTRFERVGALFQGQFRAKPVMEDRYLMALCVYIHANPVKDELVAKPEDWEFSNYREWVGLRAGTLVDRAFIHDIFGTHEVYQKLVNDYLRRRAFEQDIQKFIDEIDG